MQTLSYTVKQVSSILMPGLIMSVSAFNDHPKQQRSNRKVEMYCSPDLLYWAPAGK